MFFTHQKINKIFFLHIRIFSLCCLISETSSIKMPPQLLHIVLGHLHSLLTDINDKVAIERKLLSQLDDETNKNIPGSVKNKLDENSKELVEIRTGPLEILANPVFDNHTEAQADERQRLVTLEQFVVPELPTIIPDPFDDAIFNTPKPTIVAVNPLDETPAKKFMLSYMKTNNVSYYYASTYGLAQMMDTTTAENLQILVYAFENTISRMIMQNKIRCLEKLLTRRLQKFAKIARITPMAIVKVFSQRILLVLDNPDTMYPEVKGPFLKYDSIFNDEEGDKLLNSVVLLHVYGSSEDKHAVMAPKLTELYTEAFLAPTKRMCGAHKMKDLINEINQAYMFMFPNTIP